MWNCGEIVMVVYFLLGNLVYFSSKRKFFLIFKRLFVVFLLVKLFCFLIGFVFISVCLFYEFFDLVLEDFLVYGIDIFCW